MEQNRVIKFRAFDLDNQVMYYSDRDEENGEAPIIWFANHRGVYFEELQIIDTCPGGMGHEQESRYCEPNQHVMQFTGLKDKNGKDVYEGDIVKGFFDPVEVEDYLWCQLTDEEKATGTKVFIVENIHFGYEYPIPENIELIGNIHENPELLK